MGIPSTATEIHLASRPVGLPSKDDFAIVRAEVREPGDGEVVVRNDYLSVDPYMRGRMNDVKSYIPPFRVGEVMDGGAVGTVVASRSDELAVGDTVLHEYGWREYAVAPATRFRAVDTTRVPASSYLSVLGMPGQTAYFGLFDVAAMRPGDTVFVSGAAGAVGSLVGQFAKLRGARRVIGSAGSADKVAYLREELGFDEAFNYKDGPVAEQLAEAAPRGIDVYFDNVGGDHLEAALTSLRTYGRVAMCGAITQYNDTEPAPGPRNLFLAVTKRLSMRGFIVMDFAERAREFTAEVSRWVRDDRVRVRETVTSGISSMPDAFLGLFSGDNLGKMLVRLDHSA
ncbi:hypothetical protein SAMN06265360_1383 [Haloechinothrix alba]|uniref:Enoyl reductase (ER) domain-containing protein n=1 Tax=Haloechinothrix alba TaxID=664784 RepID=A0A239AE43_9PSEU|nr:NADP-dependent oxidoreductase [Haloechinothrix alba]SNR93840.1 hypothetical protein SAMN06265360_1383 [Haloechinothrix alba]